MNSVFQTKKNTQKLSMTVIIKFVFSLVLLGTFICLKRYEECKMKAAVPLTMMWMLSSRLFNYNMRGCEEDTDCGRSRENSEHDKAHPVQDHRGKLPVALYC